MTPFISAIAFWASASVPMVTKPNPRDLPVSRSDAMCTSLTSPKGVKAARIESGVALKDRLPT
jgi:hypothetical protein